MRLQDILTRLKGVKKVGTGYIALCPAHNDRAPSLSLKELPDKILIHCQAGCSSESVLRAMGLSIADLFFESTKPAGKTPLGTITKVYPYHNTKGSIIFEVVRYEP